MSMSSPPEEAVTSALAPDTAATGTVDSIVAGESTSPDRGTVMVGGRAFRVVVAVGAALATFLGPSGFRVR